MVKATGTCYEIWEINRETDLGMTIYFLEDDDGNLASLCQLAEDEEALALLQPRADLANR